MFDNQIADRIDLRPLLVNSDAAAMLLLARGQLNRAFRQHGLSPPDPLLLRDCTDIAVSDLDDPAASGIEHATHRFKEPFVAWAAEMPIGLAQPVLQILRQTHEMLNEQRDASETAKIAVLIAHDFLLDYALPADGDVSKERRVSPA